MMTSCPNPNPNTLDVELNPCLFYKGGRDVGDHPALLRGGVPRSGARHAAPGVHRRTAPDVGHALPDVVVKPRVSELMYSSSERLRSLYFGFQKDGGMGGRSIYGPRHFSCFLLHDVAVATLGAWGGGGVSACGADAGYLDATRCTRLPLTIRNLRWL